MKGRARGAPRSGGLLPQAYTSARFFSRPMSHPPGACFTSFHTRSVSLTGAGELVVLSIGAARW